MMTRNKKAKVPEPSSRVVEAVVQNGAISQNDSGVSNVSLQNRFSPLNNNENVDDINLSPNNQPTTSKIKGPPIFVDKSSVNASSLISDLKLITNLFSLKEVKEFFKLDIENIDDYRAIVKFLDNKNFKYHSYRLPVDKTIDVVMKHIPTTFNEDEIKEELTNLGFKVSNVTRVWNKQKAAIPVVFIYLHSHDSQNKDIYNLERFLNCVVQIQPKKKSVHISQCYNCQRYGHTKNYCRLTPKCLFCAGPHKADSCPNKTQDAVCANCKEQHAANFKGCKYYEELRKRRFFDSHPARNTSRPEQPESLSLSATPEPPPPFADTYNFPNLSSNTRAPAAPQTNDNREHSYARLFQPTDSTSNHSNHNIIEDICLQIIQPLVLNIINGLKPMIADIVSRHLNGPK